MECGHERQHACIIFLVHIKGMQFAYICIIAQVHTLTNTDTQEHIKKSLEALKNQSGSSSGDGMANDASKAGQNAPTAGSMESLKNLPDDANDSYTGAETLK